MLYQASSFRCRNQPAGGFECAQMPSDAIVVSEDLSLWNLYTDKSKVGNGCVFPSGGRPVWFGSVFSGRGSESDYSITFTYSSNEVDGFPSKDSVELGRIFAEVKEMLKTLQLKPPIVISGIYPESSSPGARVTIHGSGFHLFNQSVEVRFKEFPNNPMPPPVIALDGNSLTFEVPTSINTISCPPRGDAPFTNIDSTHDCRVATKDGTEMDRRFASMDLRGVAFRPLARTRPSI
jgi:hypothetical protein